MPVPGPRTQDGPVPGYRNPEMAAPNLFNLWKRPAPIYWPGRSPGYMVVALRGCRLAAGQVRRMWRQSIDYNGAQEFSWTHNANVPMPGVPLQQITRALRYMTRSFYMGGGIDHSRFDALHTVVNKQNMYKTVTVNVGQQRNRPTIRNRLTSFGSRVPALNESMAAAENQPVGRAGG